MDFDSPLTNIEFNGNLSAHEPFGYELDDFSLPISQRSPSIRPKRTSHETFSSFAIYLQCIDDTGIRVLAFTELGYRHMTNSKHPIKTPDDIVGLKMRTMNDPYQISAMEALGAAVTPMAYSELFTALQQKVIDGQENPCQNIWTEKFYEVQDYMTTTKHSYTVQMLGISESYFQSLPEDVQTILLEEARNVELRNREELEAIDNEQLEELKKVMDVYELNDEEFAVFRDAASVAWDDAKNAMGEEYFDLLMSEVEKAEKG